MWYHSTIFTGGDYMVATNHAYLQNQPSIAQDLYSAISNSFSEFIRQRNFEAELKKLESKTIQITSRLHGMNAKMEEVRDFVDLYHINDVQQDEIILNKFYDLIDEDIPELEAILDSHELTSLPIPVRDTISNAVDELYSTMVNINFAISQKIALAHADSKSDFELLQEA